MSLESLGSPGYMLASGHLEQISNAERNFGGVTFESSIKMRGKGKKHWGRSFLERTGSLFASRGLHFFYNLEEVCRIVSTMTRILQINAANLPILSGFPF